MGKGRPPTGRNPRVQTSLTPEQARHLEAAATSLGVDVATAMRMAVVAWLQLTDKPSK